MREGDRVQVPGFKPLHTVKFINHRDKRVFVCGLGWTERKTIKHWRRIRGKQ